MDGNNTPYSFFLFDNLMEIMAVTAFYQRIGLASQLCFVDKIHVVGNFFYAADLGSLPLFNHPYKFTGIAERFESSSIEPRSTPIEYGHFQLAYPEVFLVYVCDLILASGRRL